MCEVSARDGDGIENLIEGLLLQADVMELKAARAGQAEVSSFFYILVTCILFHCFLFLFILPNFIELKFCISYFHDNCCSIFLCCVVAFPHSFLFFSPSKATVLDACLDKGRGIIADVLVQWGELSVGDAVVIGTSFGRVKSMEDHLVRN